MPKEKRTLDWHRETGFAQHEHVLGDNGTHSTEAFTREALHHINTHDANLSPMFLYLAYTAPHTPVQVPKHFVDLNGGLGPQRRAYGAMVTQLDQAIGQLVDALKRKSMWHNTVSPRCSAF